MGAAGHPEGPTSERNFYSRSREGFQMREMGKIKRLANFEKSARFTERRMRGRAGQGEAFLIWRTIFPNLAKV